VAHVTRQQPNNYIPHRCTPPVLLIYLIGVNKPRNTLQPNNMLKVKSIAWEQQTRAASARQAVLRLSRTVHCWLVKGEITKIFLLPLNDQIAGATTSPSLPSSTAENNLRFSLPFQNGNFAASCEFETTGNFTVDFCYCSRDGYQQRSTGCSGFESKMCLKTLLLICPERLTCKFCSSPQPFFPTVPLHHPEEIADYTTIEWLGLEATLKIIWFQPPCHEPGHLPPAQVAQSFI